MYSELKKYLKRLFLWAVIFVLTAKKVQRIIIQNGVTLKQKKYNEGRDLKDKSFSLAQMPNRSKND